MEEAEEQGFLEDVNVLQTAEEHAKNLAILKEQKDKRITWVVFCRPSAVVHRSQVESSSIGEAFSGASYPWLPPTVDVCGGHLNCLVGPFG